MTGKPNETESDENDDDDEDEEESETTDAKTTPGLVSPHVTKEPEVVKKKPQAANKKHEVVSKKPALVANDKTEVAKRRPAAQAPVVNAKPDSQPAKVSVPPKKKVEPCRKPPEVSRTTRERNPTNDDQFIKPNTAEIEFSPSTEPSQVAALREHASMQREYSKMKNPHQVMRMSTVSMSAR